MSPDRATAGKLVGNLYIAAKILTEGRSVNLEAVRHEIRTLFGSTSSAAGVRSSAAPAPAAPSSSAPAHPRTGAPGALSPQDWKNIVTRLLFATQQLPNSIGSLSDAFKRELASAIQQGRQICAGSKAAVADALGWIDKAAQLYRTLSGASYL